MVSVAYSLTKLSLLWYSRKMVSHVQYRRALAYPPDIVIRFERNSTFGLECLTE